MTVLNYTSGNLQVEDIVEIIGDTSSTTTLNLGNTLLASDCQLQYDNNTDILKIQTNGGAGLSYFDNSGHLGINTSTPKALLHAKAGASGATLSTINELTLEDSGNVVLQMSSPNTANNTINFGDPESDTAGQIDYDHATDILKISTSGGAISLDNQVWLNKGSLTGAPTPNTNADDLVIESSGAAGISIFCPNTNSNYIYFGDPDNAASGRIVYNHSGDILAFSAATNEVMRLTDGQVWLGKGSYASAPSSTHEFVIENATESDINLIAANGGTIRFSDATSSVGFIQYNHSSDLLQFGANSTNVTRLSSTYFAPNTDNATTCGASGNRWSAVWAANGTIQTSDERLKILEDETLGLDFINALQPKKYRWIVGQNRIEADVNNPDNTDGVVTPESGVRYHHGLSAQQVRTTLDSLGVDSNGFAGWGITDLSDPDSEQYLNYAEFISPLIKAVQELTQRCDDLSTENEQLRIEIDAIKSNLGI